MKYFIIPFLILSMVITPELAFSNTIDDANEMLAFQKQNTENFVSARLNLDLSTVLKNISGMGEELNLQGINLIKLDGEMQEIAKDFSRIQDLQNFTDDEIDGLINEMTEKYRILNRKLFGASWQPSTAAIFQKEFIGIISQMIGGLKYQCEVGRNDISFNPRAPMSVPPPPLGFSIFVETSTAGDQARVGYDQYNYTSVSKDMKTGQDIASYSSSAGFMVAANTSYVTAGLTVGIASLAVVAVIAAISYFSGAKKRFKLMKEYHRGELHKFYNSLTTQDVSNMYKERCVDIVSSIEEAATRIKAIGAGGAAAEKEKQRYYKEKNYYITISNQMKELDRLNATIAELEANKATEEELKPYLEKQSALSETLDKKNAIGMAAHFVVEAFGINSEKIFKKFNLVNVKKVFIQRQEALSKIQKLVEIKKYANLEVLNSEVASFKEYLSLRSQFLNLLSDTFEYIWSKKSKSSVLAKAQDFAAKINLLQSKYLHVPEFRALKNSSDYLIHFLESEQ